MMLGASPSRPAISRARLRPAESERRARNALSGSGVRLEGVVVGRDDHMGATLSEVFYHSASEGAPLHRVSAGPHLIQQNQARNGEPPIHAHDVGHVA